MTNTVRKSMEIGRRGIIVRLLRVDFLTRERTKKKLNLYIFYNNEKKPNSEDPFNMRIKNIWHEKKKLLRFDVISRID